METLAELHRALAEIDERIHPCPVATRQRELRAEKEKREANETCEKQQAQTWSAMIDQHIEEAWELHREAIGEALGKVTRDRVEELAKVLRAEIAGAAEKLRNEIDLKLARPLSLKEWQSGVVFYVGDVAIHNGSTFQAQVDTCQPTDHPDWVCLARAGRDGVDVPAPNFTGAFSANKSYMPFDVATLDGNSYVATVRHPGVPGIDSGWRLLAARGSRGADGPAGPRGRGNTGPRGKDATRVVDWIVDTRHYTIHPVMSDGKPGPKIELRNLFQAFLDEVGEL